MSSISPTYVCGSCFMPAILKDDTCEHCGWVIPTAVDDNILTEKELSTHEKSFDRAMTGI